MFEPSNNDTVTTQLRSKAICAVAVELHIARRTWTSYPPGHPLITASIQKLMASIRVLCADGTVSIGITRDGLLLGESVIEKGNVVCKQVAAALFERGIGVLILHQTPAIEELESLLGLLSLKREEILARGGILQLWQTAGISSLEIRAILYDRFSVSEVSSLAEVAHDPVSQESLWSRFVRQLLQGDVGLAALDLQGDVRPEVLAAVLNAHFSRRTGVGSGLSSGALHGAAIGMQQLYAATGAGAAVQADAIEAGIDHQMIRADLAAFLTALDPVLRRQFINGFCDTGQDTHLIQELFDSLGEVLLQKTYANAREYASAPPVLQQILKALLPHINNCQATDSSHDDATTHERMSKLLQEHQAEAYMPDEYMQDLRVALQPGQLQQIRLEDCSGLLETLAPQFIDGRSSEIIMQLVIVDPEGEDTDQLINNLTDLCGHFLALGDYGQVLRLLSQAADPRLPQPLRLAMRDAFCRREFLDEILSGLSIWGKPKYEQVTLLIQVLGQSFIEPLLDRLAIEDSMSLRRFLMDRIQSFGEQAHAGLLRRLSDERWFVLRNIIIMLRSFRDIRDAEQLRPLLRHSNQKVQAEALRSLQQLGDPLAQRMLLRMLESNDHEQQLSAISMADRNSSPELMQAVLKLATGGGFTAVECEVKSAAIQSLADIGKPEVLPELTKVLAVRSMLAFKALHRIKFDIVRSFEHYPAASVQPLLERLAAGSDDLARRAAESLKNLRSKPL